MQQCFTIPKRLYITLYQSIANRKRVSHDILLSVRTTQKLQRPAKKLFRQCGTKMIVCTSLEHTTFLTLALLLSNDTTVFNNYSICIIKTILMYFLSFIFLKARISHRAFPSELLQIGFWLTFY